jgi:hypothetical protein
MINSYCENLEDMFAQLVYYGVLREEDAQCFSVSSSIEKGAYVLAGASVVLTFLCSFVVKAVGQYLREETDRKRPIQDDAKSVTYSDETSHTEDDDDVGGGGYGGTIHPVPVLFSDSFRWLLRPDTSIASSARALFADSTGSHWSLPEATAIVDDSSDDDGMIKGTYVSDLGPTPDYDRKVKQASRTGGSLMSLGHDSLGDVSRDADRLTRGRKLTYDDEDVAKKSYRSSERQHSWKSEKRDSSSSVGLQSVQSKMESMDSSCYKDEASTLSENESLAYSLPSSMGRSIVPPPPESDVGSSPSGYTRKAPPPTAYRLSDASMKKTPPAPAPSSPGATAAGTLGEGRSLRKSPPPPAPTRAASSSYFKRQESSTPSQPMSLKKPPPRPASDEDFTQMYGNDYDFVNEAGANDDGEEMYTINTSSDMFMDDDSEDVYFGENYSQHSHRRLT